MTFIQSLTIATISAGILVSSVMVFLGLLACKVVERIRHHDD